MTAEKRLFYFLLNGTQTAQVKQWHCRQEHCLESTQLRVMLMAIGIVQYFIVFWEGRTGHALCLVGPLSGSPTAFQGPAQLTPGLICCLSVMQRAWS